MVLVFAHGLDHPPARLAHSAQRLKDQLHLGILERLAHGEAVVAGFGAGRADMDQEVAPAGHQLGRRAADFRAIDAQIAARAYSTFPDCRAWRRQWWNPSSHSCMHLAQVSAHSCCCSV